MSTRNCFATVIRLPLLMASICIVTTSAFAQVPAADTFPKLAVEVRAGVTSPKVKVADGGAWEPGSAGSIGMNLGARPSRFVQLDFGLDASLHVFGAEGSIETTRGTRSITDREVIVTMGPRLVIPTADDTVLLSIGTGYAYTHYSEFAQAQTNEQIVGFNGGSRSGHGSYAFVQLEFAPSKSSPVTFGTRVGFVQSTTNGARVGQFRGNLETQDTWPSFVGTISFRGFR